MGLSVLLFLLQFQSVAAKLEFKGAAHFPPLPVRRQVAQPPEYPINNTQRLMNAEIKHRSDITCLPSRINVYWRSHREETCRNDFLILIKPRILNVVFTPSGFAGSAFPEFYPAPSLFSWCSHSLANDSDVPSKKFILFRWHHSFLAQ